MMGKVGPGRREMLGSATVPAETEFPLMRIGRRLASIHGVSS